MRILTMALLSIMIALSGCYRTVTVKMEIGILMLHGNLQNREVFIDDVACVVDALSEFHEFRMKVGYHRLEIHSNNHIVLSEDIYINNGEILVYTLPEFISSENMDYTILMPMLEEEPVLVVEPEVVGELKVVSPASMPSDFGYLRLSGSFRDKLVFIDGGICKLDSGGEIPRLQYTLEVGYHLLEIYSNNILHLSEEIYVNNDEVLVYTLPEVKPSKKATLKMPEPLEVSKLVPVMPSTKPPGSSPVSMPGDFGYLKFTGNCIDKEVFINGEIFKLDSLAENQMFELRVGSYQLEIQSQDLVIFSKKIKINNDQIETIVMP